MNETISEVFDTSTSRIRRDNMPVLVRKGTRDTLAKMFKHVGFTIGAEIGTKWGVYAKILCEANPGLHLYCVDPWMAYHGLTQEKQEEIYNSARSKLAPYRISIVRKTSMEALDDFLDLSLDFVFIDGNHTFNYACPDIIFWAKKVRKGGIVAVHDYMNGFGAGVMKAVDAYTHCNRILPWFVTRETEPTAFWMKT